MYSYRKIKKELTIRIIGIHKPESGIQIFLGDTEIMGFDGNQKMIGDAIYKHFKELIIPVKETKDLKDKFLLLVELECSLKDFLETEIEPIKVDFEVYCEDEDEDNFHTNDLISQYFADDYHEFRTKIKLTVRTNTIRLLHAVQKKIRIIQIAIATNSVTINDETEDMATEEIPTEMIAKAPFDFKVANSEVALKKAWEHITTNKFIDCSSDDFIGFFKGTRMKKKIIIGKGNITCFGLLIKEFTKQKHIVFIPLQTTKSCEFWNYVLQMTRNSNGAKIPVSTLINVKPKSLSMKKRKLLLNTTLDILKIPS